MVALGIAASRLAGLGRETVAARLLGNTAAGDAFAVAMRIPNLLQNLLGEGVLSASFVPVYSRLLDDGARRGADREDPGRVAGAVAAALMTVVGLSVALIVTLARPITFLLAPGLTGDRFDLAVSLVRITALGTGFAVLSAWCLGVLNSHRRFFVSYAAPVLWNAVQVGALVVAWILAFDLDGVARALAWGVAGGGLAQLLVQLPLTVRLARGLRLRWMRGHAGLREIRRRFGPAVLGRGVVQVSAYVDLVLASLLATGAMAALYRAQILYMLPVSLFAMSVAAAELPEMSRQADDPVALATRSRAAMRKVAFWMLLAAAVYTAAGDLVVGLLFQGGVFSEADTVLVWFVVGVLRARTAGHRREPGAAERLLRPGGYCRTGPDLCGPGGGGRRGRHGRDVPPRPDRGGPGPPAQRGGLHRIGMGAARGRASAGRCGAAGRSRAGPRIGGGGLDRDRPAGAAAPHRGGGAFGPGQPHDGRRGGVRGDNCTKGPDRRLAPAAVGPGCNRVRRGRVHRGRPPPRRRRGSPPTAPAA